MIDQGPSPTVATAAQLLRRVRRVIAGYEGGEPMVHAYRLIRAVAGDRATEILAVTALVASAGMERLQQLRDHAGHAEVVQLLDSAITTLMS